MKKSMVWLAVILLAGILATWVIIGQRPEITFPGQSAAWAAAPDTARGHNPRFYAVQEKLDQGGSFYLYADLKDSLSGFLDRIGILAGNSPPLSNFPGIARQVVERLGLYGVHDLGISEVREGELTRGKLYISAPEGRKTGLLALLGGEPHPFSALDRAPTDTMVFVTADVDAESAGKLIRELIRDIGGSGGEARLDRGLQQIEQQTGINLPQVIPTLENQFHFFLSQDPSQKMNLPVGRQPLTIDALRLTLMARVKDDLLYRSLREFLVRRQLTGAEVNEGSLRITRIQIPPNPVWPVSPTLGYDGENFYFSTHEDYLRTLAQGKPADGGLRSAAEYKKYAAGLPAEGNGLIYVSERVGEQVSQIFDATTARIRGGDAAAIGKLVGTSGPMLPSLVLRVNEPNGVLAVSQSKGGGVQFAPFLMVAPAAILAAIAVPNFLEAQTRSKVSRVRSDMRTFATAIESYYIDNNTYPACSNETDKKVFGQRTAADPELARQPTFMTVGPDRKIMTLTTPIAYLSEYFADPFAPVKGATFSYYSINQPKKEGWILWSPGPDGRYDLTFENIKNSYDPAAEVPDVVLINQTFDPTNGTTSQGDVWRVKQ